MLAFSIETERETKEHGTVTVYAYGSVGKFYPATMFNGRGDPGDDAEGGEVDYTDIYAVTESGEYLDWESDYDLDQLAVDNAI